MNAFNKVKQLWYTGYNNVDKYGNKLENILLKDGYFYEKTKEYLEIYESNIPPLLRLFHIKEISPSGWISLQRKHTILFNK